MEKLLPLLLTNPLFSAAANVCPPNDGTVIIKCTASGGSIYNLLLTVVNFLSVGVGVAVLIGIVLGSFLYASSDGNPEQSKRGTTYIRNSIIALVIFIFMFAIINFIVPGGLL